MADPEPQRDESPLQQAIQTQHPEIRGELQNAIDTLHKLQRITGSLGSEPAGVLAIGPGAEGWTAPTLLPPAGHGRGIMQTEDSAPRPVHSVRLLAERENFGRYQIVRLLGRGGMGAVYLAYDPQLERYVALKTPFLGETSDTVQRFYREARAAAKLRSPFTCTIYDVAQVGDIHYLSMEFIEGEPLAHHIQKRSFPDHAQIGQIIGKIALGLQKAHELGIIHRDLKPDNVMIDADQRPIVMDFGLARRTDDVGRVTNAGALLGTPAYMSPEQVAGDQSKLGPATDIYSLGVILFEMLTGRLPFQGSVMSVLQQIGRDAPPRPSALAPEMVSFDSPLERLCLKMLSKSPANRPASMAEVAEEIERAGRLETSSSRRPPWRKRIWLVLSRALTFRGRHATTHNSSAPKLSRSPAL